MPQIPCPYCGQPHDSLDVGRCSSCNGLFEPLSEIATQLAMGPWFIRDEDRPFMPGFNEAILRQQITAGRITANTIMRGPTTNQFWMNAADVPGVSRLMGTCHACHQAVEPTDSSCQFCKADLSLPIEANVMGLRYTTEQERTQAQEEITQARTVTPKPASKPVTNPSEPKVMKGSTIVEPDMLKPVEQSPSQPQAPTEPEEDSGQETDHGDANELANEFAEDVWHAGPTSSRRRRRKKGADPLVIGMGVMLLCVFALGGLIILTGGPKDTDEEQDEQAQEKVVERDVVAVSRVSVPAITMYERLVPEEIPAEFEERYEEVRRLARLAAADKEAKRYNEAFDAYKELGELVTPLEQDIAQWQADQQAKTEATELRNRVAVLRQQAEDADAQTWALQEWNAAQATWDKSEKVFTSAKFVEASDLYAQAESAYLSATNKSKAGQVADNVRTALNEAIKASTSEASLRQFANEQMDAMQRLRKKANNQLGEQQYAQAEQSFSEALDALREAQKIVELAKYRKYYAFEAGFQASGLMLGAARGDGVDAAAQGKLAKVFEKLRIVPNPASGITSGDEVGFTVAIDPLVNQARDAIAKQYGDEVQACYLIGFHTSIIDQTLKTISLTDDQQKRIHQSLSTIERAAEEAGWNINKLRPIIDQVRITNRKTKLKTEPDATRTAWKRLIDLMQSRSTAPSLMEQGDPSEDPADPELFPTNRS